MPSKIAVVYAPDVMEWANGFVLVADGPNASDEGLAAIRLFVWRQIT